MVFNYNESHKAPRDRLFVDPPSYNELIKLIASKKMKLKEKAYLAIILMTGARTTEALSTKQKDYKFYYNDGSNKTMDMVETQNLKNIYERLDFGKFIVTMRILKQKKERYKRISCIRNEMFVEPFDWFVDYFKTLPVNPDAKVFPMSRGQCWWMIKRTLGTDYWNHFFRHASASNDVASGINIALVQNKLGHKTIESMSTYLHMRSQDTEDALKKAYGDTLQNYPAASRGPLNPNQVMGALAATNQIGERRNPPYYKKEAIIQINDKKIYVPMNQNARTIRDNIRKEHPEVVEKYKEERAKFIEAQKEKGLVLDKSGTFQKTIVKKPVPIIKVKQEEDVLQVV